MTIRYTEHIPPFDERSGQEPETGTVESLEQLLELPWMQRWAKLPMFKEFELGGIDMQIISAVYTAGERWVVAYIQVQGGVERLTIQTEDH